MGGARGAMRILLVCDSLAVGGAERHVASLARILRTRGHEVSVACSTSGALDEQVRREGIPVETFGDRLVKRTADPAYRDWLRQLVARVHPDLVHAHMHASAVAAADAVADTGHPLVITEHSEATWRDSTAWSQAARAYAQAGAVVAVSSCIADGLVTSAGVDPSRVHVIHNALTIPVQHRRPLRRSLPCRDMVGVVARLLPEKGIDVFLRAAARVAARRPRTCFTVLGDGPERAALEQLASDLSIRSVVGFLGARDEATSAIGRLDILCVPSRSEGTPLVVLEAMAAGTPIVATNVGGIPEQVQHDREALLVDPDDDAALAAAVERLLEHRLLRMRLVRSARRRVRREFSVSRMIESLEHVYAAGARTRSQPLGVSTAFPAAASA